MKIILLHWRGFIVVGLLVIIYGCVSAQETRQPVKAQNTEPQITTQINQDPYQKAVVPLTTRQCGQCHFSIFEKIRNNGGKHKINCRDCHATFHSLRPGMTWSDVLPKCANCHAEEHGPAFKECLTCHSDPHAPIKSLTNLEILAKGCNTCHVDQDKEIKQYESAHAEMSCSECHHTQHGYRPNCNECHTEPHTEFVDNSSCMICHPAHSPREINFPTTTENRVCSGCHDEINRTFTAGTKKHASLQCIFCHSERHGFIPDCRECHGVPHTKTMMSRFNNNCTSCHGDPHTLTLAE